MAPKEQRQVRRPKGAAPQQVAPKEHRTSERSRIYSPKGTASQQVALKEHTPEEWLVVSTERSLKRWDTAPSTCRRRPGEGVVVENPCDPGSGAGAPSLATGR